MISAVIWKQITARDERVMKKVDLLKIIGGTENLYSTQSIYCNNVGVESTDLYTKGKFFSSNQLISQLYLSNYENCFKMGPIVSTAEFMDNGANVLALMDSEYKEILKDAIFLPKPRKIKTTLQDALINRRSSRTYSCKPISLQDFSDFLYYSRGAVKNETVNLGGKKVSKQKYTAPSGGGMYATKFFLVVYNVKEINPGIYIYQPASHSLLFYMPVVALDKFVITKRYDSKTGDYVPIENFSPSVFICCINDFAQQRHKYGELSLAVSYVDCGCLLQNCGLIASALELDFCVWAGFKKREGEKQLKIDGLNSHIIMTAMLGVGV